MIVSKSELMMFTLRPMTCAMALIRSASIPITVWPSGAMNSFGAYWASDAMRNVPLALIFAGTVAAIAGSVVADTEAVLVFVVPVLLLLLPQPASRTIVSRGATVRTSCLLIGRTSVTFGVK